MKKVQKSQKTRELIHELRSLRGVFETFSAFLFEKNAIPKADLKELLMHVQRKIDVLIEKQRAL